MPDDITGGNTDQNQNTTPWYTGLNEEMVGHSQTKGWDMLAPDEAARQITQAHRSLEKMLGVPQDQLLRMPKADDEIGQRAFWQRLGAPEKAEGYEFPVFTQEDLNTKFQSLKETAATLGVPKAMAERLAQGFHKAITDQETAKSVIESSALAEEQRKLEQDWGAKDQSRFKANMFIADQAADKLGITPEALAKLKNGVGASDVAAMFLKIGIAMGEDKFVTNGNPANQGILSREQAVARRTELSSDNDWVKRYLGGGRAEMNEMMALQRLIADV